MPFWPLIRGWPSGRNGGLSLAPNKSFPGDSSFSLFFDHWHSTFGHWFFFYGPFMGRCMGKSQKPGTVIFITIIIVDRDCIHGIGDAFCLACGIRPVPF